MTRGANIIRENLIHRRDNAHIENILNESDVNDDEPVPWMNKALTGALYSMAFTDANDSWTKECESWKKSVIAFVTIFTLVEQR
jgi:hypothetical protein